MISNNFLADGLKVERCMNARGYGVCRGMGYPTKEKNLITPFKTKFGTESKRITSHSDKNFNCASCQSLVKP